MPGRAPPRTAQTPIPRFRRSCRHAPRGGWRPRRRTRGANPALWPGRAAARRALSHVVPQSLCDLAEYRHLGVSAASRAGTQTARRLRGRRWRRRSRSGPP
ncbi:MAG: hypothetical protein DWH83_02165 [Planctomycetota bacterium]|nr:MAG: hypothetical protein DWH83_02165 [Planctomycetota bacterium]